MNGGIRSHAVNQPLNVSRENFRFGPKDLW